MTTPANPADAPLTFIDGMNGFIAQGWPARDAEVAAITSEWDASQARAMQLKGERNALRDEVAALTVRVAELERENASLRMHAAEDDAAFESIGERIDGNEDRAALFGRLQRLVEERDSLKAELAELRAACKPFVMYANAVVSPNWPDSTGCSLLFRQPDGSMQHNPNPTLGDCRRLAALLAGKGNQR